MPNVEAPRLHSPKALLGRGIVVRLQKAGFTVTPTTITGGTDGLLMKLIPGFRARLTRLKKLGIRA